MGDRVFSDGAHNQSASVLLKLNTNWLSLPNSSKLDSYIPQAAQLLSACLKAQLIHAG